MHYLQLSTKCQAVIFSAKCAIWMQAWEFASGTIEWQKWAKPKRRHLCPELIHLLTTGCLNNIIDTFMRGYSSLALTSCLETKSRDINIFFRLLDKFHLIRQYQWYILRVKIKTKPSKFSSDFSRTARLTLSSYGPIVAIRKIVVKSLWSRVDKNNTLAWSREWLSQCHLHSQRWSDDAEPHATQDYLKNIAMNKILWN